MPIFLGLRLSEVRRSARLLCAVVSVTEALFSLLSPLVHDILGDVPSDSQMKYIFASGSCGLVAIKRLQGLVFPAPTSLYHTPPLPLVSTLNARVPLNRNCILQREHEGEASAAKRVSKARGSHEEVGTVPTFLGGARFRRG